MPATTYERFDGGLDVRQGQGVADANKLRELTNAYVTTGKVPRKRPGTVEVATLEAGTVGLISGGGKLNTFYGHGAAITHANPLFLANRIAHPSVTSALPSRVRAGQPFLGYLYVAAEYSNGDTYHSYLDVDTTWQAAEAVTVGTFRQPVTANGYRYECTIGGTTGAFEPTWPTTVGATVADGSVTWTCRAKVITDANCPHHESITFAAQKVWSPSPTGETVRFCATSSPRDWSAADDAGFLPTGVQASGSTVPVGVGRYRKQLAVAHEDAIQVWTVDPDPANHAFDDVLEVGTTLPFTLANLGQDLHLLSPFGFRSLSQLQNVDGSLSDQDVGSPVDSLVLPDVAAVTDTHAPASIFYRGGGQLWTHVGGGKVWVYTFSRTAKIRAWSLYEFPFAIDDMAELNSVMYLRSGDTVYRVDPDAYDDDGTTFEVVVELAYQAMKKPGQLKQFIGLDAVMQGAASVSHRYRADDTALLTDAISVSGDTRAGGLLPVEVCATEIATRFVNSDAAAWQLDQFTLYYDVLGPM